MGLDNPLSRIDESHSTANSESEMNLESQFATRLERRRVMRYLQGRMIEARMQADARRSGSPEEGELARLPTPTARPAQRVL